MGEFSFQGERVAVVTPWRPDGGLRTTLWDFCRDWWGSHGVAPVESASPEGPFNRGAAINAGLAGDWDCAVVMDADVICEPQQVADAVKLAVMTRHLVFPFTMYIGLAPWGTRHLLDGQPLESCGTLRRVDIHESSILAIPRSVWDTVGGFDERFVGWGQDDVAFCQSVRVLAGEPERIDGIVWHLWHEPAAEKKYGHPLWEANQALGRTYREATTREAMEALLWERNGQRSSPTSTSGTLGTVSTA